MAAYKISVSAQDANSVTLAVGFGDPSQNDQIVRDAAALLDTLVPGEIQGKVVKVNGPASLPVAMVLAHRLAHVSKAVACFDPKLAKFVVAISHDPAYKLGDLID